MAKTAEEAMLLAALDEDQEELERLAAHTYPKERRDLIQAMDRVHNALIDAALQGAGHSYER